MDKQTQQNNLVMIPAYEPDESLLDFTNALLNEGLQVLVVDDGSSPSCRKIFDSLDQRITLLSYGENHGKGYAMKFAMDYIRHSMEDIERIVTADADGQHAVADTLATLNALDRDPHALILGVRSFPENTPLRSRIGNRMTAKFFALLTGVENLEDTQTGLRAFSRESLPFMLEVDGERYEYEMKQLLLWAKTNKKIIQVPIETIYRDKENSTSHYNTILDSVRIFRTLLDKGQAILFAVSGFLSFLLDYGLFNLFFYSIRGLTSYSPLFFSNVAARIISCCFNFYLNRKYVFESRDNLTRDALQYGLLVIVLLTANNLLLYLYGKTLNFNPSIAKLFVELTLFVISYIVQRVYIFSNLHLSRKKW